MTQVLDESFEFFYTRRGFGPAVHARPVSPAMLDEYRGKLPAKLLQYWQEVGLAGYADGLFWMTDPGEYSQVIEAWLINTEYHGRDKYHVIGRSAFGTLDIWGQATGTSLKIVANAGMIFPSDKTRLMREGAENSLIENWIATRKREALDEEDEQNIPLFERAVERLGALQSDEMYGFVPALAMGGPCRLDHLKRVKATEHLLFLALLDTPKVMLDIVKEAKDRGVW